MTAQHFIQLWRSSSIKTQNKTNYINIPITNTTNGHRTHKGLRREIAHCTFETQGCGFAYALCTIVGTRLANDKYVHCVCVCVCVCNTSKTWPNWNTETIAVRIRRWHRFAAMRISWWGEFYGFKSEWWSCLEWEKYIEWWVELW